MAHRILLGLLSMLIGMASVAHANSKASKTVLVYQTVGQPPVYSSQGLNVRTADLGYTSGRANANPLAKGLVYGLSDAKESNTGIAQLPYVPALDSNHQPLTQTALLTSADAMVGSFAGVLAIQMTGYMKTVGAASAIFNYQQQVMVQGNAKYMTLAWQMIVDINGRPRYGKFQLIPSAPDFVYGVYVPQAVDAGLPSTFYTHTTYGLPNPAILPPAGNLQWYQVDKNIQPLTGMTNIALNGAFDSPTVNPNATGTTPGCQPGNPVSCDPDYGLKCLINHASDANCPTTPINGYTDFISLENAHGASAGWLDYVRSLTPVYTTDPTDPTQQIAVVTVDVSSRVWQQGGQLTCTSPIFYPMSWPVGAGWLCVDNISGASHYLYENSVVPSSWGNAGVSAGTGTVLTDGSFITLSHNDPGGNCPLPAVPGNYILLYQYVSYYSHGNKCRETEYYFSSDGNQYTYSSPSSTSYMFFGNYGSPYLLFMSGSRTFTATSAGGGSGSGAAGAKYTNSGTIDYTVQSAVDRYYVTPDGTYVLTGEINKLFGIPQYPYTSQTVSLPSGANPINYSNIIIDPFGTTQMYDYTSDTVNGLPATSYSVAPICHQSSVCP